MNKQFSHALAPIRVNRKFYKNRICVAPITPHSSSNGELYPNEAALEYFESRARTGAGMVWCAGAKFVDVFDDGEHCTWDTEAFNHKNALNMLSARIHAHGALAGMEAHGLTPASWRQGPPITCSDGNRYMQSPPIGQEMTKEEIKRFVEAEAKMCANLQEVGFDAILFHFGHQIPIAQFLSPMTNHRTDEYGGSLENRTRICVEILDACREATHGKMIFEVRMSATEFSEDGYDVEEGIRIAEILQEHCDVIQASCGQVTEKYMTWTHPCQHMGYHPNLWLAEAFKKSGKIHVPVTAVGGLESLQVAEEAIAEGKCDFYAVTRQLIADPEMIKKGIENRQDDVTPCIKCMRCHDSDCYQHLFRCAVNPTIGYENCADKMFPETPERSKNVAVIGGGPAGMKAAITAYDRGHKVTLFEAKDYLGGALDFAKYVEFKYALCSYKDFLIKQLRKRDITVNLNTEVKPQDLNGKFDALIIAVGAEPVMLPVEGYDLSNGIIATSAYGHEGEIGDTVVIIGGGQVGCETALHLAEKGKKVSIVEMQEGLCPEASKTCADEIRVCLDENENFTAILNAACKKVEKHAVTYTQDGQDKTIEADTVILAAGMKAKSDLADSFIFDCDIPEWYVVGDCVNARTVEEATAEAYNAAMSL